MLDTPTHSLKAAMYRPACRMSHTGVRSTTVEDQCMGDDQQWEIADESAGFRNTLSCSVCSPSPRAVRSNSGSWETAALHNIELLRVTRELHGALSEPRMLLCAALLPSRAARWEVFREVRRLEFSISKKT